MASLTDDPAAYADAETKRAYREAPEAVTARIARLAKEVADAGQQLDGARTTYDKAARNKDECQGRFVSLADELMQAIHEHREGAPEGVPYPRYR